jgi:hypothetical protein
VSRRSCCGKTKSINRIHTVAGDEFMKTGIKSLVLAAAMVISGAAMAADTPAPGAGETPKKKREHAPGVRGKVESTTATTIVVKGRDGTEKTITVDSSTKYTLDGAPSDFSKVVAGIYVMATPETGTATDVKAMTKLPDRKPKGDAPAPAAPAAK